MGTNVAKLSARDLLALDPEDRPLRPLVPEFDGEPDLLDFMYWYRVVMPRIYGTVQCMDAEPGEVLY